MQRTDVTEVVPVSKSRDKSLYLGGLPGGSLVCGQTRSCIPEVESNRVSNRTGVAIFSVQEVSNIPAGRDTSTPDITRLKEMVGLVKTVHPSTLLSTQPWTHLPSVLLKMIHKPDHRSQTQQAKPSIFYSKPGKQIIPTLEEP